MVQAQDRPDWPGGLDPAIAADFRMAAVPREPLDTPEYSEGWAGLATRWVLPVPPDGTDPVDIDWYSRAMRGRELWPQPVTKGCSKWLIELIDRIWGCWLAGDDPRLPTVIMDVDHEAWTWDWADPIDGPARALVMMRLVSQAAKARTIEDLARVDTLDPHGNDTEETFATMELAWLVDWQPWEATEADNKLLDLIETISQYDQAQLAEFWRSPLALLLADEHQKTAAAQL